MQLTMKSAMYQDKSVPLLILGSIITALGSMLTKVLTGMTPILGFITRADITFTITCMAGVTTMVAGVIKSARDWKEGKLKIPFVKSRRKRY